MIRALWFGVGIVAFSACAHYGIAFLPESGEYEEVVVNELEDGGVLSECSSVCVISDLPRNLIASVRRPVDAGMAIATIHAATAATGVLDQDGEIALPLAFRVGSAWSTPSTEPGCTVINLIDGIRSLPEGRQVEVLRTLRCAELDVEVTREVWRESRGRIAVRLLAQPHGLLFLKGSEAKKYCSGQVRNRGVCSAEE
jgi:hypothetical protein